MKKTKNRSEVSLSTTKSEIHCKEVSTSPLDVLNVKVLDLLIPDEDPKPYALTVTIFDQTLLSSVITSSNSLEDKNDHKETHATGHINYDPSDSQRMCLFANSPLIIKIYELKRGETNLSTTSTTGFDQSNKSTLLKQELDVYCCNIDILSIFTDKNMIIMKKRMEPTKPLPVSLAKSWDNHPLITIKLKAVRNKENEAHHQNYKAANYFKMTLIGCYNLIIPFEDKSVYTVATKMPISNDMPSSVFTFSNGYKTPKKFNSMSSYPHWESLRLQDQQFTKGDEKFQCNLMTLQNDEHIDLTYYLDTLPQLYTTIWASFHRTLLLKDTEQWLSEHIRRYKWPLEFHIYGENYGYSFMGFMDLFKLLYPGETSARLVVPLHWTDPEKMMEKCGCELLLHLNENVSLKASQKTNRDLSEEKNSIAKNHLQSTGSDDNCAFAIVEVTLARPFKKLIIPPHVTQNEIKQMLIEMESISKKHDCSGRGQTERDWQTTVQNAAYSLRRIPYYGASNLWTISKQLGGSRTRVELVTSFCQEAALYVNNNFVVGDFLRSSDTYEEMVMTAHACLMKIANETLIHTDEVQEINYTLRAARHARQLQDLSHAISLYLQSISEKSRDGNIWRELATTLRDVDTDWANVCIDKSLSLDPRHPLSILSKGCMVMETDPDAAEPFFVALLSLYPFFVTLWVAANAYYLHRELFNVAESIMEQVRKAKKEGLAEEMRCPRSWEWELGDWWDSTPLLPGTSMYYDAADLLLRIRALSLAEICIGRALSETGVSPVYYHMVGLCFRLKGNIDNALCHVNMGIKKFGEISYLRTLEGECYHKNKEYSAAMASFKKASSYGSPYGVLLSLPRKDPQRLCSILSDVVRRHPSAYAWIAFAEYWVKRSKHREAGDEDTFDSVSSNAISCALRALKYDRRAGRAWALLANLLSPSNRRRYCKEMAALSGYTKDSKEHFKKNIEDQDSSFSRIGKVLRECRCNMCENLSV